MPRCFGASGSVRASMNIQSAYCAPEVQIFCPLITKSSPSRTARVCSDARSEPEPGSENPWHHCTSPERIRPRCSFFCSSLPCTMSVGPTIDVPMPPTGGTRFDANSSFMMNWRMTSRPAPPYSFGQAGAIQPRFESFSRRPLRRSNAPRYIPRSMSSDCSPDFTSLLMKSRTSCRNAACSPLSLKSIVYSLSQVAGRKSQVLLTPVPSLVSANTGSIASIGVQSP